MLRHLALGASGLLPFLLSPAAAVTFTSGAYATSVQLTAGGIVAANATTASVAGTAGPGYDRAGGVAAINQSFNLGGNTLGSAAQGLRTGIVSTAAASDAPTTLSATASASLANVNSGLTSKLVADLVATSVLGLTADAISSTTTVGVDGTGALFGMGASAITNLGLTGSVLGALTINGALYANPTANTVILSLAGLVVTLNEQVQAQTADSLSYQTNAVHIALNNYALNGQLLSGDVILGHSEAQIGAAVPEAGTWATMLIGFSAIGFALRRRRPLAVYI